MSVHQQRLDVFTKSYSTAPSEGHLWDCTPESRACVLMPDSQVINVPIKQDTLVTDVLFYTCKVLTKLV